MKQFLSFVHKEFLQIFRDKRTMFILLVMPLVICTLFGFAISTEVKNTKLAVLDFSKDEVTRHIVERFGANRYFTIQKYLTDIRQADEAFRRGDVNMVLVFSDNFAEDMRHTGGAAIQILADGTEPNQAAIRMGHALQLLESYRQEQRQLSVANGKQRCVIIPELRMLYNPGQRSEFNFVPGVIAMMVLLICAMMSSIAIVREKEMGTMEVLLASPLPPAYIIMAKMVPYFAISCFNLATILLMSVHLLHVPVAGSLTALIGIALIYILTALALGLLISTIVDSQLAAMLLSGMLLMIPTILLSGTMFPVESMPVPMQYISMLVPARWFTSAVRKLMIQGTDARYVAKEFIVITGMAAVLLAAAWRQFKIRL